MSEDKIVNGYYQTNITTSRGENSTYTAKYTIDKLQQLDLYKEIIDEVRRYVKNNMYYTLSDGNTSNYVIEKVEKDLLQILDKAKEEQ